MPSTPYSAVRTASSKLRSCIVLTPPVLSPYCWRHTWAMPSAWGNIACLDVFYMESWLLAKDNRVVQTNAIKTLLRPIFSGAISSQRISILVLDIVCFGGPGCVNLQTPLKMPAANDLLQSDCSTTRLHLQWPEPNSSAPTVPDSVSPDLVCGATSKYIGELPQRKVTFESKDNHHIYIYITADSTASAFWASSVQCWCWDEGEALKATSSFPQMW